MKKRTLRRVLAQEIGEDELTLAGAMLQQTDPEGEPTYNERGEEID